MDQEVHEWRKDRASDTDLQRLELSVDAYYLNIGIGDCSVYYLVEHPPKEKGIDPDAEPKRLPFVHRAVLIDGGKVGGAEYIIKFLQRIGKHYIFDKTRKIDKLQAHDGGKVVEEHNREYPPFDSIVITHWDDDHYGGVLRLLSRDVKTALGLCESEEDKNKYQTRYTSPYLTYASKEEGGGVTTVLYTPYWGTEAVTHGRVSFGLTESRKHRGQLQADKEGGFVTLEKPEREDDNLARCSLGQGTYLNWIHRPLDEEEKPKKKARRTNSVKASQGKTLTEQSKPTEITLKRYIKVLAGVEIFLGVNLFTGRIPDPKTALNCKTPQSLATWHRRTENRATAPAKHDEKAWPVLAICACREEKRVSQQHGDQKKDESRASPTQMSTRVEAEDVHLMPLANRKQRSNPPRSISWSILCVGDDQYQSDDAWKNKRKSLQEQYQKFDRPFSRTDQEDRNEMEEEVKTLFPKESQNSFRQHNLKGHPTGISIFEERGFSRGATPPVPTSMVKESHLFAKTPVSTGALNDLGAENQCGVFKSNLTRHDMTSTTDGSIIVPMVYDETLKTTIKPKMTNALSLASAVIWTTGQVSSFHAGDADWELELRVACWISGSGNPFKSARTVKLQHHGATDSTPASMIRLLKPRSIILQAGGTNYGHPRPEVLFWLHLWALLTSDCRVSLGRGKNQASKGFSNTLVKNTCLPYYLQDDKRLPPKDKVWDMLYGTEPAHRDYQTSMKAMIKQGIPDSHSLVALYDSGKEKETPNKNAGEGGVQSKEEKEREQEEARRNMVQILKAIWPQLSEVTTPDISSKGQGESNYVQYIKSYCRPTNKERRYRADRTLDGYNEVVTFTGPSATTGKTKASGVGGQQKQQKTSHKESEYHPPSINHPAEQREVYQKATNSNAEPSSSREIPRASSSQGIQKKKKRPQGRRNQKEDQGKRQIGKTGCDEGRTRPLSEVPPPYHGQVIENEEPPPSRPYMLVPDFVAQKWQPPDGTLVYRLPSEPATHADLFGLFLTLLDQPALRVNSDNSVHADDNLRRWLLWALGKDDEQTDPGGFSVAIDRRGSSISSEATDFRVSAPSTSDHPEMTFSIQQLNGNFADAVNGEVEHDPSGFFPSHNLLALGLHPSSKTASSTWTLLQVLKQANIDEDAVAECGAVLQGIFEKLGSSPMKILKGMLWFAPRESYFTVQRMEWSLTDSNAEALKGWCQDWLPGDLQIDNPHIVTRRISTRTTPPGEWIMRQESSILIMADIYNRNAKESADLNITCGLDLNLKQGSSVLTATIRIKPRNKTSSTDFFTILGWMAPGIPFNDLRNFLPVVKNIQLCSVEMDIGVSANGGRPIQRMTCWAKYTNDKWVFKDKDKKNKPVSLMMRYSYLSYLEQPHALKLFLWFPNPMWKALKPQVLPLYEDIHFIMPDEKAPESLPLHVLMPGSYKLPAELDVAINSLEIGLEQHTVYIFGSLSRLEDRQRTRGLGIRLGEATLEARYNWRSDNPSEPDESSYSIELTVSFDITGDPSVPTGEEPESDDPELTHVSCEISLIHEKKSFFELYGSLDFLDLSKLSRFFPSDDAEVVHGLLGHIAINKLEVCYRYDPDDGVESDFYISGTVMLRYIALDLEFQRDHHGWNFEASVHSVDDELIVADVIEAIMGEDSASKVQSIPEFVRNISVREARLQLTLRSEKPVEGSDPKPGRFLTCLDLRIPGPSGTLLDLAFLQITDKKTSKGKDYDPKKHTKRLIKVTFEGLPWHLVPEIPIVDKLEPPFDALGFYWVQDSGQTGLTNRPGLTCEEAEELSALSSIAFRSQSSSGGKQDAKMVVIEAGLHFLVLDASGTNRPQVVIDYLFGRQKAKGSSKALKRRKKRRSKLTAGADKQWAYGDLGSMEMEPMQGGTVKAGLTKKLGPLSLSNIGVRYQDEELIIYVDATAHLGPLKMMLVGLGIGFDVKNTNLQTLFHTAPSFHLQGMGVELDQPPVGIVGMFVQSMFQGSTCYAGGVSLSVKPYRFMAVGAYGEIQDDQGDSFKTVFLFAKLDGPLVELGFATIGGICLGFGYNSSIHKPSVEEVHRFPLIDNSGLGGGESTPLEIMAQLIRNSDTAVVTPQKDSYWLAAGLSATAFHVLDVSAVLVLQFGQHVSVGILAKAVAQMPPPPTPRSACFIYAELGVVSTIDFEQGIFRTEAQLSPNSFIFAPPCKLTGGFALCSWFGPSTYAGDFVFSIGGYHSAFKPPVRYPQPPRLRISWVVDSSVSITGEAYFALTPKVCMAGGKLSANYWWGNLHAWFNAQADFLVEYSPFAFTAYVGVSVGVEYVIRTCFVEKAIGGGVNAKLSLWGIPFGGSVWVDFWAISFSVPFGSQQQKSSTLTLKEFRESLERVPDAEASASGGSNSSVDRLHVLSVVDGMFVEKRKANETEVKQNEAWEVKRSSFVFQVTSRIPLQEITQTNGANGATIATVASQKTDFFGRPMRLTKQLGSNMTVSITKDGTNQEIKFRMSKTSGTVMRQLPSAIWGYYDASKAPGNDNNNIRELLDPGGGTMNLLMGTTFEAPPPHLSRDKFVDFEVARFSSMDVFPRKEAPALPDKVTYQAPKWRASEPCKDAAAQWKRVQNDWENPKLRLPEPQTGQRQEQVVDLALRLWAHSFGWRLDKPEKPSRENNLRNYDLSHGTPLLWKKFDELYMAAPMVIVGDTD